MANMVVRTNVFALNAHRNMKNVGAEQQRSSNRLASGFRINSAADDAAGLAISETMRAQIRGLDQASRNAQDGQALINTAEGGMQEIQNMMQRIRELTVQAANDTNAPVNREQIGLEINQLLDEIDSMANRVEFNGMTLLDGSFAKVGGVPGIPGLDPAAPFTAAEALDLKSLLIDGNFALGDFKGGNWFHIAAPADITKGGFEWRDGVDDALAANVLNTAIRNALAEMVGVSQALIPADWTAATQVQKDAFNDAMHGAVAGWLATVSGYDVDGDGETFNSAIGNAAVQNAIMAVIGNIDVSSIVQREAAAVAPPNLFKVVGNELVVNTDVWALFGTNQDAAKAAGIGALHTFLAQNTVLLIGDEATIDKHMVWINAVAQAFKLGDAGTAVAGAWGDLQAFLAERVFDGPTLNTAGLSEAGVAFRDSLNAFVNAAMSRYLVDAPGVRGEGLWFQIGANSGQGMIANVADMRLRDRPGGTALTGDSLGGSINEFLTTWEAVFKQGGEDISNLITKIDTSLENGLRFVSDARAALGAMSNRLDFTSRSLDISSENLSDAESRVRNTDMAREMMRFTMSNVLQQAAVSMLAQANQLPNNLLQLLR